jgi:hypothetical protein
MAAFTSELRGATRSLLLQGHHRYSVHPERSGGTQEWPLTKVPLGPEPKGEASLANFVAKYRICFCAPFSIGAIAFLGVPIAASDSPNS